MIDFTQPNATLDWAAAHLFDQLFNAKYRSGKLTMKEYVDLIEASISHVIIVHHESPIKWFHFRAGYRRKKRLGNLRKLCGIIYNSRWHSSKARPIEPLKDGPTKSIIKNYVPGEIYMGPAPKPIKPARTGE
jgi:hypothetical protein